ncbi:MAG: hypothetical protein ACT4P7_15630 [Gemmatimonadaceae bacterium]
MSRAAFAAWRGLLAAGGAPAASHAVLARLPACGRLLEPMPGARFIREGVLDRLVCPLDAAGVLARILERSEPHDLPDESTSAHRARRESMETSGGVPDGNPPAASDPALAARVSRVVRRASPILGRVAKVAAPLVARRATRPAVRAIPTIVRSTRASAVPRLDPRSPEAQSGAALRVLIDAPPARVAQLLRDFAEKARGSPERSFVSARTLDPAPRGSPGRVRATDSTRSARSDPDALPLLERVVERAHARRSDTTSRAGHVPDAPRSNVARLTAPGIVESRSIDVGASSDSAHSSRGFRGLALRALQSSPAAAASPARTRVELAPEARLMSELPVDTLDSRVAESLARVLEREARRQGVDLARAGT